MLTEIDSEMEKRGLEGVIVSGDSTYKTPDLFYVVGTHLHLGGTWLKVLNEEPLLLVDGTDLQNAEDCRVKNVQTYVDFDLNDFRNTYGRGRGTALFYKKVLTDMGLKKGRVSYYPPVNIKFADRLRRYGVRVVGDDWPTLFNILRETKEPWEIEKIKKAGKATEKVMEDTVNFLQSCGIRNGKLRYEGKVLTVGKAKGFIRERLARENLDPKEGLDFIVGEKGSNPSYDGKDDDIVFANKPILVDIYPCHDGAYFFDTTRTFVKGVSPDKFTSYYVDVLEALNIALKNTRSGVSSMGLMRMVCNHFERRGHETYQSYMKRKVPESEMKSGFMTALGHGLGLTDKEAPWAINMGYDTTLKENSVIALEPGLYDPSIGGVRIEDVVVVKKNGIENLSSFEKKPEIII